MMTYDRWEGVCLSKRDKLKLKLPETYIVNEEEEEEIAEDEVETRTLQRKKKRCLNWLQYVVITSNSNAD